MLALWPNQGPPEGPQTFFRALPSGFSLCPRHFFCASPDGFYHRFILSAALHTTRIVLASCRKAFPGGTGVGSPPPSIRVRATPPSRGIWDNTFPSRRASDCPANTFKPRLSYGMCLGVLRNETMDPTLSSSVEQTYSSWLSVTTHVRRWRHPHMNEVYGKKSAKEGKR